MTFTLSIGGHIEGGGGDSMAVHNGKKFTTKDNDNDNNGNNCAILYPGGWWYQHKYFLDIMFKNIDSLPHFMFQVSQLFS